MNFLLKLLIYFILSLLSFNAIAYQNFKVLKAEVTGRSVISSNDLKKARRLALEDALYLASLKGGAFVDGFSSVSKSTILNDQSIIKTNSKILDFKILSEKKNNEHYEVKILAMIANKGSNLECKAKPLNLSIFKPTVIYNHSLPSYVIRSMHQWNEYFINKINSNEQIITNDYSNIDLNKIIKSSKNFSFDYESNVNGIPSVQHGEYIVAPIFKVDNKNTYKQANNPYDMAEYVIELNFFIGPSFKPFKTLKIKKTFQNKYPSKFQLISALSSKSKEQISSDVNLGITEGVEKMINTFNCLPIEAQISFKNNSLYVNLGQKHGLKNRQIGIVKKNYKIGVSSELDTTVLFISEIGSNQSKLTPLNDKIKISELNKMKIQFIE